MGAPGLCSSISGLHVRLLNASPTDMQLLQAMISELLNTSMEQTMVMGGDPGQGRRYMGMRQYGQSSQRQPGIPAMPRTHPCALVYATDTSMACTGHSSFVMCPHWQLLKRPATEDVKVFGSVYGSACMHHLLCRASCSNPEATSCQGSSSYALQLPAPTCSAPHDVEKLRHHCVCTPVSTAAPCIITTSTSS